MSEVANTRAGQRVPCQRCAKPCVVAATRKTDAKMAIEADGTGLCAECIVTAMLKGLTGGDGVDKHRAGWFPKVTAESFRLPHIQQQVLHVLKASGTRLPADDLDWDEIVANYHLPIPAGQQGGLYW